MHINEHTPDYQSTIQEKPVWTLQGPLAFVVMALRIISPILVGLFALYAFLSGDPDIIHLLRSLHNLFFAVFRIPLTTSLAGVLAGCFFLILIAVSLGTTMRIVDPGEARVLTLFGKYVGTIRTDGLSISLPFTTDTEVSTKIRNFETQLIKVNDLEGNPINIAAIVVWQVTDTARAVFGVENYESFVHTQAEAALRHVAGSHPYDTTGTNTSVCPLLGSTEIVSEELAQEVSERIRFAGVDIIEVRISSLSYAPEIAQAMLQRQQAGAIIAAREQIVEGAVSMVHDALKRLEAGEMVSLNDEQKAELMSNLMVVLCSESHATPVVTLS